VVTVQAATPDPIPRNNASILNAAVSSPQPTLLPTTQNFGAAGGQGFVSVSVSFDCGLKAISNVAWIKIANPSQPASFGVHYAVDPNPDPTPRIGTINIGKQALTVIQAGAVTAPAISKSFGTATLPVNGTTALTFTVTNPNPTVALTGVSFTDTFPSGLVVADLPAASNGCGGAFSASAGASGVSLNGGTVPAGGSCTISVNVTPKTPGLKSNTTGSISSTNGGIGAPSNTATITTSDKCLKDDKTRDLFTLNSVTGDYLYVQCSTGFTVMGRGKVQIAISTITLTDSRPDGLVTMTMNTASGTGSALLHIIVAPGVTKDFQVVQKRPPGGSCACGA
jgi:uncharacterized repeat protein (TIGR01451 family)